MSHTTRPTRNRPWQPRFGLGSLMLFLLVCAMTAAGGRYLVRALHSGTSGRAIFLIMILALPVLLVSVVSGLRLALIWATRTRRK